MSSDKKLSKTVAEIEIEDPLDFLTVAEKEEYIRKHLPREEGVVPDPPEDAAGDDAFTEEEMLPEEEILPEEETIPEEDFFSEEPEQVGRRDEAAEVPVSGDRTLSIAVKLGALVIALLLTYIVWLLFLRPVVRSVFGWNSWEAVQEEESAQEMHVLTTSQLNLRNGPSTQTGEIVVTVPEGTRLTKIAEADGWTTVLYEGQTLYCSSEYLKAAE